MMKEKKFDLQDRLIDYAVRIMKMSEKSFMACHIQNGKINTRNKVTTLTSISKGHLSFLVNLIINIFELTFI